MHPSVSVWVKCTLRLWTQEEERLVFGDQTERFSHSVTFNDRPGAHKPVQIYSHQTIFHGRIQRGNSVQVSVVSHLFLRIGKVSYLLMFVSG